MWWLYKPPNNHLTKIDQKILQLTSCLTKFLDKKKISIRHPISGQLTTFLINSDLALIENTVHRPGHLKLTIEQKIMHTYYSLHLFMGHVHIYQSPELSCWTELSEKLMHPPWVDTLAACHPSSVAHPTYFGTLLATKQVHNPISHNCAINQCHTSTAIYHIYL